MFKTGSYTESFTGSLWTARRFFRPGASGFASDRLQEWNVRKETTFLGLDCFNQGSDAKDIHHSLQVVRQHMQAHLGTYPVQCFR